MFVAFVLAARIQDHQYALEQGLPGVWNSVLLPAKTFQRRDSYYQVELDVGWLEAELQARQGPGTPAVVFAVDRRPDEVQRLRSDLVTRLPGLEIVPVKSKKRLEGELLAHLDYYGIGSGARPSDLTEALELFSNRYPQVYVLGRAWRSAKNAADFADPRIALFSLHYLYRLYVVLYDARRRALNPGEWKHQMFRDPRTAMRELLGAHVDISGESQTTAPSRQWMCEDGVVRNFEGHVKIDLGGSWGSATRCRIHYCREVGAGLNPSKLYLGHCGEHLPTTQS